MVTVRVEKTDINQIVTHVINYKCDIWCKEILATRRKWSPYIVGTWFKYHLCKGMQDMTL